MGQILWGKPSSFSPFLSGQLSSPRLPHGHQRTAEVPVTTPTFQQGYGEIKADKSAQLIGLLVSFVADCLQKQLPITPVGTCHFSYQEVESTFHFFKSELVL